MAENKIEVKAQGDTLIIREGIALPVYEPKSINIVGDINAPQAFFSARLPDFAVMTSYCIANVSESSVEITLIGDDRKENKISVKGIAKSNPEVDGFQLNTDSSLTVEQLLKLFQRKRSLFPNLTQHAAIMSALRNFKANIQTAIERSKDTKGNEANHYVKQVESGLPESFDLVFKPFMGGSEIPFTVETEVSVVGDSVSIKLFCFNLADVKRASAHEIIAEQTKAIKDAGIAVIENFSF